MASYEYNGSTFDVTGEMVRRFEEDGYIVVRKLLSSDELKKCSEAVLNNKEMMQYKFGVKDVHGNESAQITWNQPGNDITGLVARSQKVAGTAAKLLGGEVYHYHSKVVLKDPHAGGARAWHQDYGYWYQNGCLYPDMLTVFIAVDKADKANGCLQVLRGSQKCGRIEHTLAGQETGADLERVEHIKTVCSLDHLETEPGDAVFFHSNLLHMSAINTSDRRRLALLIAYNMAYNNPVKEHHHPQYCKLEMVSNDDVAKCTDLTDMKGKDFLDMLSSKTIKDQVSFEKSKS